jgi:ribosomal protein L37E
MRDWRERNKNDNPEEYRAKANQQRRTYLENNPVAQRKADDRCTKKAVDEKKHYCAICDHTFTKKAKLTKHLAGPRHPAKAAQYRQSSS